MTQADFSDRKTVRDAVLIGKFFREERTRKLEDFSLVRGRSFVIIYWLRKN